MKKSVCIIAVILIAFTGTVALAAYHHQGESDSDNFTAVYPAKAGTKLDQCVLCHRGGEYEKSPGKIVTLGSCQWCHYEYGYDGQGNILNTLNGYGEDYHDSGRNQAAVQAIEDTDSDGDGYTNIAEINAVTFPGDDGDDPSKTPAAFRVYSLDQIEAMPQHIQFLLMNTSRSGDFYAEYTGVVFQDLLEDAGVLDSATGITVYAPDGWSNYHPMEADDAEMHYPIKGVYAEAQYQYNEEADEALNADGWCDYSAPSCKGRSHLDTITVEGGLRMILAYKRDGAYLDTGVLNTDNKLDGSGPFRVVPPQVIPCPPDQSSTSDAQEVVWPYENSWDHNAGASSRSATIIRVDPLPDGVTDIDILEAGWEYVDQGKIIIYGAIDDADSNGNGILDSEEGSSNADPKKATFRPMTGADRMSVDSDKGQIKKVKALYCQDPSLSQNNMPAKMDFPYGAFKMEIQGLNAADPDGEIVTLTFTFPQNIPTNAKFYKIMAGGWVNLAFADNDGDDTIIVTLQDGDPNTDADGIINGVIVDPGVVAVPASSSSSKTVTSDDGDSSSCFIKSLFK
ncbi:MAG: hypothetical protein JEZ02_03935 [Desulfatibacillum sp.]|nr:hypothetical protein [Desulfatibacillum sp.]